ncbi:hypothetical protein AMELA_G00024670 [Ameiurus melas]|uniref:Uncharacterized protein n=1 Tax=Ameiurus melas TaxID=219545 RepID=A0A7J6BF51_AMEME|nr:hypothetical protein AMELA_G00024670 [Ameiurus melas]
MKNALPTCLGRWITAISRVFKCWHRSDHNVQLSLEETVLCSHLSSVQPWVLNEDDGGMILHHIQPPI